MGALIAKRKEARQGQGPVLVLDAGDYSMGTPFAAASREIGGELQLMSRMGYDATTFGNHETDLGPDGLGKAISVAAKAGHVPAVLASNTNFSKDDPTLADLQRLAREGVIRRHIVIERGGIRFGLFGVLGKEAQIYTSPGAVTFADPIETAKEMVKVLRETEKVDVVIALSHGGVTKGKDGRFTDGEDVDLPRAVPGIDVVIGGHSHTALQEAIIVNGRTPVVQTGKEGENLGELVISLDGATLKVESYRLYPVDDIDWRRPDASPARSTRSRSRSPGSCSRRAATASISRWRSRRGTYRTRSPTSAPAPCWRTSCTDSFRKATKADIGFTANGMMRASLKRGKSGVQTVYDVFAVAPLGAGVVDTTAGSTLVTGYFTGQELKNVLEFLLVDNPAHPGEYFPRTSGMRFRYDPPRPKFDVVTAIEMGDLDHGYQAIDITGKDERLYSLTCPLMLAMIVVAIPKYTKGKLPLVPKNKAGQPLKSKVEALDDPRGTTPDLLSPAGTADQGSVATVAANGAVREIKEWQAIMDHLRSLPAKAKGELPVIPVDERAAEVRAIKAG